MPPKQPNMKNVPQDRGYAWMVVAGGFFVNFVVQGVSKSLGVLLIEFMDYFQSNPLMGTLTTALVAAGFFLLTGVANAIGHMTSNRTIVTVGAVLSFVSMFVTSFAPNMFFVVFSLGLTSGIAFGFMFGPTLVCVSQYFVKRRALANGIAVSGGSFGQLIIPMMLNKLIEFYGFRSGIMIFSGVLLNGIPAAMLLRPATYWSQGELAVKKKRMEEELREAGTAIEAAPPAPSCGTKCGMLCSSLVNTTLIKNPLFLNLALGLGFAHSGYLCSVIFLPPFAMEIWGSKERASLLITIMGGCDLVGRLGGGAFADTGLLKKSNIMALSLFIPGLFGIAMAIFPNFVTILVFDIVLGLLAGTYTALVVPVIADLFGLPMVPSGFGMSCVVMGMFMIPMPQVLGQVMRATGTLQYVMAICGVMCVIAGIILFFVQLVQRCQTKPKADAEKPNS